MAAAGDQEQRVGVRAAIEQPTSWGRPKKLKPVLLARLVAPFLGMFSNTVFLVFSVSVLISACLLVYVGFFVRHSYLYASDGTRFSCEIQTSDVPNIPRKAAK